MAAHKVLIAGEWREAQQSNVFQAEDPLAAKSIPEDYPVSSWQDCDAVLDAAVKAFEAMRDLSADKIANFLETFADRIESRSSEICELASRETALPVEPRLASGELPRTTGQLRQAASAARRQNWRQPVIDTATNIRTCFGPIGPVAVFGPNNFPLAFGSISGGDFAAAIAAGNPVIAKANTMHPGTTRLLAEEAQVAAEETGMPPGIVQMLYHMSFEDGEKLVADPRLGAVAFTGSRKSGLNLKAAADRVGKPIYLELSSVNPVFVLAGALQQRGVEIATELTGSCLMGTGQFCTNPGLVILPAGESAEKFTSALVNQFSEAKNGVLFSASGLAGLSQAIDSLKNSGAEVLCGGHASEEQGYRFQNTVLQVSGEQFLAHPETLQTEAFGNSTLLVKVTSDQQAIDIVEQLEGNLTGCVYSATDGSDDDTYDGLVPHLRQKVGRLLNDKMPTGVAVCPAMNHGGPYPATGHPGFTAVGVPGSLTRFAMLQCYDNVRPHRLPGLLRDENSSGSWRLVDGNWTQADIETPATVSAV